MTMNKKYIYVLIVLLGFALPVLAQNISISGTVKDAQGKPLSGVVITAAKGTPIGVTDVNGKFSVMKTQEDNSYGFSLLGYKSTKNSVQDGMNVEMKADISQMDETIDLGYTTMSKTDFSGAASTAVSNQLAKAPVSILTQALAGNLSGLTAHETYSEVGRANYDLHIRGISSIHNNPPLVVIDGVVCYPGTESYSMSYISANEIESVTILKDAASQALYGAEGSNGVLLIRTKRGVPGKIKVSFNFDESLQQVTTKPVFINSAEYATLRNEAAYNDGLGKNKFYSDDAIAKYRAGNDPLYPNTNWYSLLMKNVQQMQRMGVNVTGGNEHVTYFSNLNLMHTDGPYKTESNDKYNPNNAWYWFNFRTNLDVKINKFLSAYMNVAGNVKKEHVPGSGFLGNIYPHLFTMPSTEYGPVTPTVEGAGYPANEVIVTQKEGDSAFGMINRSGYINHTVTNIYSDFGVKADLDFLTKGLSVTGDVSYMSNTTNSLSTTKDHRLYTRTTDPTKLDFVRKGTSDNSGLNYGVNTCEFYDLYLRGKVDYKRDWNNHHLSAMAYSFYQRFETTEPMPYMHINSGVDVSYNYAHKYALRLDCGYSGSEQYLAKTRWTTTPAVSAAWIVSNESFMKDLSFISLAKLRAAYGMTANDQNGLRRYSYEDNVKVDGGGPIGALGYIVNENSLGNPSLRAEKTKKTNVGVDLGLFNWVSLSVDLFREKLNNAVITSVALTPTYQGVDLGQYPPTNAGIYENKGYEISLAVGKALKNGLEFKVGGYVAYNKNKVIYDGEVNRGADYAYPFRDQGFSYGQVFGYLVDYSNGNGFYNFKNEIAKGPTYSFGTPRVGDLKYQDLNHDGTIDEKDKAPITNGSIPNYTFGFNGLLKYKSFDLSVLVEGVGKWNSVYSGMGVWENAYDGVYGSLHRNAWTEERWNNGEKITAPALTTGTSTSFQYSDYYVYNRSYVRLKNVELGYTLPTNMTKRFGVESLRFVLSGQNLLTWDHMKSNDFGPEADSYQQIPVYRVYNIGIRANF
ncbi:MAG: SusC/RagA family TonB-linked outer membrane protein [Bacteroidota bacterium]|nr:SusC/RagA family TonB-linked outer membrane protein [Bacteroidota bacterium]